MESLESVRRPLQAGSLTRVASVLNGASLDAVLLAARKTLGHRLQNQNKQTKYARSSFKAFSCDHKYIKLPVLCRLTRRRLLGVHCVPSPWRRCLGATAHERVRPRPPRSRWQSPTSSSSARGRRGRAGGAPRGRLPQLGAASAVNAMACAGPPCSRPAAPAAARGPGGCRDPAAVGHCRRGRPSSVWRAAPPAVAAAPSARPSLQSTTARPGGAVRQPPRPVGPRRVPAWALPPWPPAR